MSYLRPYLEYFRTFSRGDILALIAIISGFILFICGIIFAIWWDIRKKKRERFDSFQATILPFKHLVETGSFPNARDNYPEFVTKLFAEQDIAMSVIWGRMKKESKTIFNQKWADYKEKRKGYDKSYWDAILLNIVERQLKDKELLNLINKILEIAKNN